MKIVAASLLTMAVSVSAFAPQQRTAASTELQMGLFDFMAPKPSKPKGGKQGGEKKMDSGVFGGKAARITVREDEDKAMWIEEDDKGNRKSAWPFRK